MRYFLAYWVACLILFDSASAAADKLAIDKIYHPYVQSMEKEFEWRSIYPDSSETQRFAYGQAVSDNLFLEGYVNSQEITNEDYKVNSYAMEARWQLTDQGEYSADWGAVAELEKTAGQDSWEASTALIAEKQWNRWLGTANLWFNYKWGSDRKQEFNPALSLQARYRYSPYFEPAVEYYTGKYTKAMGPVMMGDLNFSHGRKLHWEVGSILGLDARTPNMTWRFLAEFEF